MHLRVALRRDAEFEEGPAGHRAWLAKQAELAAAELAALAAASAGDASGTAAAAAAAGRQGGVLWSFMQHVVTMLVNRLQLTVRNVTVEFEVGTGHASWLVPVWLLPREQAAMGLVCEHVTVMPCCWLCHCPASQRLYTHGIGIPLSICRTPRPAPASA